MIDLSIALVNWNNREYLRQCLESIEAAQLPLVYDIVVSDNGSTDGSLEMLAERFPYVRVVQNGRNIGIAGGNNQCIRHSSGRHIYILNNDTLVNRDSIVAMVAFLDEHAQVGAVAGNLLNADGSLQSSFCNFPTLCEEFQLVTHIGRCRNPYFPSHNGTWPTVREVDWMSSASMVVRREAIERIGLVDEEFFIYSDETDWEYRLWQAGWKIYYLPTVTTVHYGGASFKPGGKRFTLVYRGRMLFARKHYSLAYQVVQRAMFATFAGLRLAVWVAASAIPRWRATAGDQIKANMETWRLCFHLV